MRRTRKCLDSCAVIFSILLLINSFAASLCFLISKPSPDSQPALIPTYDRSSSTTKSQVLEPLKSNVYSEALELLTTTTPLIQSSDPLNSTIRTEYSPSSERAADSHLLSTTINDSKSLETVVKDDPTSRFESELSGEHLKPQAYLDSIVNPEPYAKLLEFDEKEKPKEKPDVRVTIYHHQGFSDPVSNYGSGKPWNFYGTGYGVHYEHNKDGSYGREKGYQFEKAHGREFCDKKECQQQEQQSVAASEIKKSPVQSHVEGLLKHNNVDIQKWYRGGDYKPEVSKATISTVVPEHVPSKIRYRMPEQFPILSNSEVKQASIVTQKPSLKLHKISSYLSTPAPMSAPYYSVDPKPNAYPTYREPTATTYPINYQEYSRPVPQRSLESSQVVKPNIIYKPDIVSQSGNENRYNSLQISNHLKQPHSHTPRYYHENGNNFGVPELQSSPPRTDVGSTYPRYPQPYSSHNDFFSLDKNFWPNSLERTVPAMGDTRNSNMSPYGSTTFMPRYTSYLPQSTNRVPFIREISLGRNTLGWNPYS